MFNIKWPVTAYNNKICCESKEITLPKKKKKIHIYQEGTQFYLYIYIYIYFFFLFFFVEAFFFTLLQCIDDE